MLKELSQYSIFEAYNSEIINKIIYLHSELIRESEIQNLTKLLEYKDFIEGHLIDAAQLDRSGFLKNSHTLDLGTGFGSPGLLYQILTHSKDSLILCDSEKMKISFATKAIDTLQIPNTQTTSQRAEDYLKEHHEVKTVVAKAVGPVSRIFGWIKNCSTWNNLVLLKGPKWDDEWAEFMSSPQRNKLTIKDIYNYTVGEENKVRKIVLLERTRRNNAALI